MEKEIIELIATDRLDIPVSSMSGKLKRKKPKLAREIELDEGENFSGERAYARVESDEKMTARGMREGIEKFRDEYPRHGDILQGYIQEKRTKRETRLYFGMHEGRRLAADDYLLVMTELGFSETRAKGLYTELMDISRNLSRKRDEERSVLIG